MTQQVASEPVIHRIAALGKKDVVGPYPRMGCRHVWRIAQKVFDARRILEYGSGGSTIWLAHVSHASIVSVENDEVWSKRVQAMYDALAAVEGTRLAPLSLRYVPSVADYVAVEGDSGFDVIIVDGKHEWRSDCMAGAISRLRPGGTLFLHDSEEELYHPGITAFLAQGGEFVCDDADDMYYRTCVKLWEGRRPE